MNKPFAITLDVGSSLANKTGSWRTERPVYRDLLPPCNNACPAGENIQAWLEHARSGRERNRRKVAVEHGALLRVGRPQFQDGRQALLGRAIHLGDGGIHIGHREPPPFAVQPGHGRPGPGR